MPGYEKEGGGQQSPQNLEALVNQLLEQREQQKKRDKKIDNMENNLRVIGNLICDESGKCRLATKEDLAKVSKEQVPTADLSQLSGQDLWNQIKKNPTYEKDIQNIHLKKLKEDQGYLKEAFEDKELVGKMVSLLCDDQGCRLVFNEEVDKAHKNGKAKGQKEHFLVKQK